MRRDNPSTESKSVSICELIQYNSPEETKRPICVHAPHVAGPTTDWRRQPSPVRVDGGIRSPSVGPAGLHHVCYSAVCRTPGQHQPRGVRGPTPPGKTDSPHVTRQSSHRLALLVGSDRLLLSTRCSVMLCYTY